MEFHTESLRNSLSQFQIGQPWQRSEIRSQIGLFDLQCQSTIRPVITYADLDLRTVTTTALETGVLLRSATLVIGTKTFVSGK